MANVRRDARPTGALVARGGRGRVVREALNATTARALFGALVPGCELVALSKGAVSFGDVVALMLDTAGASDLTLATWAAAPGELRALRRLLDGGQIRQLRLLIDPSFQRRQPAYSALLRSLFGPAAVRLVVCHLKLAVVSNEAWALVLLSSANLNANHRLEFFQVSDDRALADFLVARLDEWFPTPADQWDQTAADHDRALAAWRAPGAQVGSSSYLPNRSGLTPATAEDARFFGKGWLDPDLRRVGLSYER